MTTLRGCFISVSKSGEPGNSEPSGFTGALKIFRQWLGHLETYADRAWYLPLTAFLAGIDLFIVIVPTEAILVSTVLLRPRRWWVPVLWMSIGSAIGAAALGLVVQGYGEPFIQYFFADALQSEGWQTTAAFLSRYGDWALTLMSAGPLPQQPAVVLCALANMTWGWIFTTVLVGRLAKYILFGWAATHAPRLFTTLLKSREAQAALEKHASVDSTTPGPK